MTDYLEYGALGILAFIVLAVVLGCAWLGRNVLVDLKREVIAWFHSDIEHRDANTKTLQLICVEQGAMSEECRAQTQLLQHLADRSDSDRFKVDAITRLDEIKALIEDRNMSDDDLRAAIMRMQRHFGDL